MARTNKSNPFVQLTRRDKDDSLALKKNSENGDAAEDSAQESQPSFITQVTSRDAGGAAARLQPETAPPETRATWRDRLRSLLCCLSPSSADQYYRSSENDAVVVRPQAPPVPPRHLQQHVIGPLAEQDKGKKTLVLDLDETLVHSSFKPIPDPDYIIPVEIEGKVVDVYVLKRPHMDEFMAAVGAVFEVIVFTASLAKYADPLLDLLDKSHVVRWRLFRESCCPYEGNYVKDLLALGRPLATTIIVDNSPHSYVFQPENALPIGTFIDEKDDVELLDILPILLDIQGVEDVREHLSVRVAQLHNKQRAALARHR